jgi:oligopeptide transport system permease protein
VLGFIVRRVAWIVPVLFAVSLITFLLMHAVPGGPWDREKRLNEAVVRQLNARYGLDKSLPEQYVAWVTDVIQLDLGPSFRYPDRTINEIIGEALPTTIHLGVMAFILVLVVGIPLGIIAALAHNRWPDYLATGVSTIGIATPSFILAILLVLIFTVWLKLLPPIGWRGPETWIMPTLALAGYPIAQVARYTRASMLEVTRRDYVRTAQSKGIRERAVVTRHMIRNALIPVITVLGPLFAFLVTGSFIIEFFFGVPGIGRNYIQSIGTRDYSMIMAMTVLYAFAVAFMNLVVDVLYAYIDPRIRYS